MPSILNHFHLSNSRDIVDLSETLDCCPFRQKELDYKLAIGEMVIPIEIKQNFHLWKNWFM
jgi:hypothetical protein